MSDVTDADREKAAQVVKSCSPDAYVDEFIYDGDVSFLHDAIAAALAEERRKALLDAADALHKLMPELDWDDWLRNRAKESGE